MDTLGQYLLVFILAATPWIELLLVIPAGLGLGLNPIAVAVLAYTGNAAPVFLIVYGYQAWQNLRGSSRGADFGSASKRRQRALKIWNRYGLPGLALLGPLLTGIHLATAIALIFKPGKKSLLGWMNLSLLLWTMGVTVSVYFGLEGWRYIAG